jgi:hypothetical protein
MKKSYERKTLSELRRMAKGQVAVLGMTKVAVIRMAKEELALRKQEAAADWVATLPKEPNG